MDYATSYHSKIYQLQCRFNKDGLLLHSPWSSVSSQVLFGTVIVADIHCIDRLNRERASSNGKKSDQAERVDSHVFKEYH